MLQQLMLQPDGFVRLVDVDEPTPLPEFAFSAKAKRPTTLSRCALCIGCRAPIHEKRGQKHHFYVTIDGFEAGPYCPTCVGYTPDEFEPRILNTPRSIRAENPPGKADPDWDVAFHGKPRFASIPLAKSNRAPLGFAKPYLPESFASREAEYNFLVSTQDLELSTVAAELAQTMIRTEPLDMSEEDEVREANISEHRRSGTPYTTIDPDMARRIEWERWVSQCGATLRITAESDGTVTIHDERLNPYPKYPISEERRAKILAKRAQIGALVAERLAGIDPETLDSTRAHVRHFRLRVLDYMTPEQQMEWHAGNAKKDYLAEHDFLLDTNDEALLDLRPEFLVPDPNDPAGQTILPVPPEQPARGPQEIGFHGTHLPSDFGRDWKGKIAHDDRESEEPSEFDLWEN